MYGAGVQRDINQYEVLVDGQGRTMERLFNNTGSAIVAGDGMRVTWLKTAGKNGRAAVIAKTVAVGERQRLVIAQEAVADGAYGLFFKEGPGISLTVPSATYTAGNGLLVDASDAAIVDSGAQTTLSGATGLPHDFFAIETGGTTVTSVTGFLIARETVVRA